MYVFAKLGRHIPRTAQQQYNASIHLRPRMQRSGDLVFFYSGSSIYHVGIYAGNGYMYVAPRTGSLVQKQRIWTSKVYYGRVR
jgi:cell wall-associated NlpC family hydrolase